LKSQNLTKESQNLAYSNVKKMEPRIQAQDDPTICGSTLLEKLRVAKQSPQATK